MALRRRLSGLLFAALLVALAMQGGATAVHRYRSRQATIRIDEPPPTPVRAYAVLLAITMMNPMTVVYFAALVLGSEVTATADRPQQAVFVIAALAASASWQLLLAGGGALLGRALTGPRQRRRRRPPERRQRSPAVRLRRTGCAALQQACCPLPPLSAMAKPPSVRESRLLRLAAVRAKPCWESLQQMRRTGCCGRRCGVASGCCGPVPSARPCMW